MNSSAPQFIDERYRLEGLLGEGGHATVHRAIELASGEVCVVKELKLSKVRDLKTLELFEREIEVLSTLDHPRIPRLRDHFTIETDNDVRVFLVQDLIEGNNLVTWMDQIKLSVEQVLSMGRQLIDVLVYLHTRRPPVIHRDIKPSNVIVQHDGTAYLIDFGAVRDSVKDSRVGGSTVVGTFGYMAPEQFRGLAEPATDVYGLGATMLFLLTGRDPSEFEQNGLALDIRRDGGLSQPVVELLEAMLQPDVRVRASYLPQLPKAFDRVRRGALPFLPQDGVAGDGARARALGRDDLPDQVRALLSPELIQMTDDLREFVLVTDRLMAGLKDAKSRVSFVDTLNVFTDSAEEREVKGIKAELKAATGQHLTLKAERRELVLQRARRDPLFVLALSIEAAAKALDALHTDRGESRRPRTCQVFNLAPAFEALAHIEGQLNTHSEIGHTFEDLSERIHAGALHGSAKSVMAGLSELERGVVSRAIEGLETQGYRATFEETLRLQKRRTAAESKKKKARAAVGFWDVVNPFSDSPEEVKLKALSKQLGGVYSELQAARSRLKNTYDDAIAQEPLLQAIFAVARARRAFGAVTARSVAHTRTVTKTRANGKVRTKQKTVYTCSLRGVSEARRCLHDAETAIWSVFGKPLSLGEIEQALDDNV